MGFRVLSSKGDTSHYLTQKLFPILKVLLVEDDPLDAKLLQRALHASTIGELQNSTARSLADTLKLLAQENFDAVVLDLNLPDSKGLHSVVQIKQKSPSIPIIVLTGSDDTQLALDAVKAGAQDFLIKGQPSNESICRSVRYAIERKRFEELTYEHSKKSALLDQLQEFMAALTHDLKGPLAGTSRLLEMLALERMGTVSDEQERVLLMLKDNNDQLLSMIQRLIDMYQFQTDTQRLDLKDADIVNLISESVKTFLPLASKRGIKLTTELSSSNAPISIDLTSMRRLINNLLDNALKFTAKDGQIIVRTHTNNNHLIIEVEDSGCGIAEEVQEYLFQRFKHGHQGQHFPPGSGLGLYLCKKIADLHAGDIECVSKVGNGSTFRVTLPLNQKLGRSTPSAASIDI